MVARYFLDTERVQKVLMNAYLKVGCFAAGARVAEDQHCRNQDSGLPDVPKGSRFANTGQLSEERR